MRRTTRLAGLALAITFASAVASAQPSEPLGKEEAIKAFKSGRDLVVAGKHAEALPLLTRSFELLPSPNTELLIATAHRATGKKARAAGHYERARDAADAEVAKGAAKYQETAAEARRALDELSKELGVLDILAPSNRRVTVTRAGDDVVTITGSGRVWASPGAVMIELDGGQPPKSVEVTAGTTARVELGAGEAAKPVEPPPVVVDAAGGGIGGVTVAGIIVGGVGLAGIGMFAGFGSSAQSAYDELEQCGCSLAEAETLREDGKRSQLIANASLGIGLGLAAGGLTMILVDVVIGAGAAAPAKAGDTRPILGAGYVGLDVTFR